MGEWPGERRTLPRELGVLTAPLGARLELTRCWLPGGGPRLGRGPFDGMRRDEAALGLGAGFGRAGGGIKPAELWVEGLGGGGIAEARWALFAAGNDGTGGDEEFSDS